MLMWHAWFGFNLLDNQTPLATRDFWIRFIRSAMENGLKIVGGGDSWLNEALTLPVDHV